MRKMMISAIRKVLASIGLFVVGANACEIPEATIVAFYGKFPKHAKHLALVNGLLARKSHVLDHVRFDGNFGPLNPEYLCHYSITHPQLGLTPTSDKDAPQDCTTSIVQQIVPSPAGGRLVLPGARDDFFNQLSHEQIGLLLKLYARLKADK